MSAFPWMPIVSSFDLLTRGYFHDRVIPALSSAELSVAAIDIQNYTDPYLQKAINNQFKLKIARTRPVVHSVPKRKHLRRMLTIPHPLPYAILCDMVQANWPAIYEATSSSSISLSLPTSSESRAVQSLFERNQEPGFRSRASVGMRYVLKTDLSRFYPSIYTHSIPWAIHGKEAARNDPKNALYGNRLDACVRELQDRQTGGIPIGPDTSYLLGEIVACRIDAELRQRIAPIELLGTRYIDDYHLYFKTRSAAEQALSALHQAVRMFELEINDMKTEICELPDVFEPKWKSDLRSMTVEADDSGRSLYALFDRATEYASVFPFDSVFTYVAKKLLDASLSIEAWATAEPLLLRAAVSEPTMLPVLTELLGLHGVVDQHGIRSTIEEICGYHAPLQQGYEIAWALWLACVTNTSLSGDAAATITQVDDDIVALVGLDLRSRNLLPFATCPLWASRMNESSLQSEHWLLAYEAFRHGWLPSLSGADYVASNPFFSILAGHNVHFYDPTGSAGQAFSGYAEL